MQGRVRRYCSEPPLAFPWTDVSKAAQKGGQAVPEIPLSVGSKLELHFRSLCLCQISVYFTVHSRICPRMHTVLPSIIIYTCTYTSPYTHAFVRVCIYVTVYAETRHLSWKSIIRRCVRSKLPSSCTSEVRFFALRGSLMIVEFSYLL